MGNLKTRDRRNQPTRNSEGRNAIRSIKTNTVYQVSGIAMFCLLACLFSRLTTDFARSQSKCFAVHTLESSHFIMKWVLSLMAWEPSLECLLTPRSECFQAHLLIVCGRTEDQATVLQHAQYGFLGSWLLLMIHVGASKVQKGAMWH